MLVVKGSPKALSRLEYDVLKRKSRKKSETVEISPELLKTLLAWYSFSLKVSKILGQVAWTLQAQGIAWTDRRDLDER